MSHFLVFANKVYADQTAPQGIPYLPMHGPRKNIFLCASQKNMQFAGLIVSF